MGVLQRFERRLGGLVEGAFQKVFKGGVEPVEIAGALARETDDRRAISSNRVLVPNQFAVELAGGDYTRLAPYSRALCDELAEMVREHAAEQRYTFVGPVTVKLSEAQDLDVGVFRIRSSVASADPGVVAGPRRGGARATPGTPRLLITSKDAPPGMEREYVLTRESTLIGRSVECDIRLTDTGVSRQHGEIQRMPDGNFLYVDAGSTNGSIVNGRPATQVKLVNGDLIELGNALITFSREREEARPPGRASTPLPPPDQPRLPPPDQSRRPGGQEPYRSRDRDQDRDRRPDPYAERSSLRGEPHRDTPPPAGRDDPYGERPGPRGESFRDGPRPEPFRDRSDSRGEPYRDAPPPPARSDRPDRSDPYSDRSGPWGARYRDDVAQASSGPRNEAFRDGGGRGARDGRDARDGRARQDDDTDLYVGEEDGYGPGRRADGRARERYGPDRSVSDRPSTERSDVGRSDVGRSGPPRGANGFGGPAADRDGPGRGNRGPSRGSAESEVPGGGAGAAESFPTDPPHRRRSPASPPDRRHGPAQVREALVPRGPRSDPGGQRSGRPAIQEVRRDVRDRASDEIYDAETELPGRPAARPRPDDDRRRPGAPPPSDRSW